MHAIGDSRLGEASGVAPRRGGGHAGRGHDVSDREEASLGEQISDGFSALSLAHKPPAVSSKCISLGHTLPPAPRSVNHDRSRSLTALYNRVTRLTSGERFL